MVKKYSEMSDEERTVEEQEKMKWMADVMFDLTDKLMKGVKLTEAESETYWMVSAAYLIGTLQGLRDKLPDFGMVMPMSEMPEGGGPVMH
jgi:phage gp29-like protein